MSKRLFIVSNRLPVTIMEQDGMFNCRPSSGGLVSAISAWLERTGTSHFSETVWAGVPGCESFAWNQASNKPDDYRYLPVFIDNARYEGYYDGFSNSLLWPLFHYFPSYAEYATEQFDAYMNANAAFADALLRQLRKDDVVWIHDYHLLPLAGMLRKAMPELTIGFFLHIPFPSYELFRVLPKNWQEALLTGMLGADLIGFHTVDYTQHFLHCLEMVLRLEHDGQQISWENRQIKADAFPISIDFARFHHAGDNVKVQELMNQFRSIRGERKLIFSVDRLDYTKGISCRLKGYERFLNDYPEYSGKVVFALNIVPSRDGITKYAERKRMIDEYIGNLNSRLGSITWQPVIYQYSHLSFEELTAFYRSCDLALITPLRDGMNLVSKEFVASRSDGKGVLVLSEMAGAAKELTDALLINPNDAAEISQMIKQGLEMPESEQSTRIAAMQDRIRNYDVIAWAGDFFEQLQKIKAAQLEFEIKFIDAVTKADLLGRYEAAGKRLFLLDYDGSLVPFSKYPASAVPPSGLLDILKDLSSQSQNDVFVISGRDSKTLETWLGHLPIGLVAEHGAKIRQPNANWEATATNHLGDWKHKVERVMQAFVSRCPGSFIERKEYSLAWHYRNVNLTDGSLRAKELNDELRSHLSRMPLQVLNGNKVIEVRLKGIHKGQAVEQIVSNTSYDFIFCVGDDKTDEDMFCKVARIPHAFSIKVGNDASFAKYNLHSPAMVQSLLQNMVPYSLTQ